MKSSVGTLALRFAATVVLFAPAVTAQAQGYGQTICRKVWGWQNGTYGQICNTVNYPPPPPAPAPEPEVKRTLPSSET